MAIDPRAAVLVAGGDLPDVLELFQRPAWQLDAACRYEDPALFFPPPNSGITPGQAKAICARCPVFGQCAAFAAEPQPVLGRASTDTLDATGTLEGVWAGTTAKERRCARLSDVA